MNINSVQQNNLSFKGYDARKLQGFIMKSDYANIPGELKKIGDKEGFKVFLVKNSKSSDTLGGGGYIETERMSSSNEYQSGWAQDFWGIVSGKKLLTLEENPYTDAIKKFFGLCSDKLQQKAHNDSEITMRYMFINMLNNAPEITIDGKTKYAIVLPNKEKFLLSRNELDAAFEETSTELKHLLEDAHISGGNYFICRGKKGKDELLIGEDELKKFDIKTLRKMFGVKTVHAIPQSDVHLDYFMRPLNQGRVLVSDDDMMIKTVETIADRAVQEARKLKEQGETLDSPMIHSLRLVFAKFQSMKQHLNCSVGGNNRPKIEVVEEILQDAGYETVRVPGRIYNNLGEDVRDVSITENIHNYMNANALVNKDGDLVYITNKSDIDEKLGLTPELEKRLGISLKKAFEGVLERFVDKSKIYYVSGDNDAIANEILPKYRGGIHCLSAEVPE